MRLQFKSLSTRLITYTLSITITLFMVMFGISYNYSSQAIIDEALTSSDQQVSNLALGVQTILTRVEAGIDGMKPFIERSIDTPQKFENIVKHIINSNPDIGGASIAFEPNFYPKYGEFMMVYGRQDGDSTIISHPGDLNNYNYHLMDWYQIPKLQHKSYWSEPYTENINGINYIITYTSPLENSKGEFIGVVTADIELSRLCSIVEKIKPYPSSYSYMVSRKGYYLAHRDSEKILNETIFTANHHLQDTTIKRSNRDIIEGRSGHALYRIDNEDVVEFYHSIPSIGWSVGIVSQRDEILEPITTMTHILIAILLFGLILLFILILFAIQRSTKHLKTLTESTKEIAKGDFNVPLPKIRTKDEIFDLRNSFVGMQHSLKEYIEQLKISTSTQEKINSELSIAKSIQLGMLPTNFPPYPTMQNVELHATLRAAKEVGGDLYNLFAVGETLYFTIGDVSGKGVPASLIMAVTNTLFRSATEYITDPGEILYSLNKSIIEKNSNDMFITMWIGALNTRTNELLYSNAGHNAPIVIEKEGSRFIEQNANIPLGVIEDMRFTTHKMVLTHEQSLLLYTDGLTEAENIEQELYSDSRLFDLLNSKPHEISPKELILAIEQSISEFSQGAEQSDDLTILALRLTKN